MRYINIGGEVIPKHCKFGPRPKEGVIFNNYEWWSITDHLVKEQREKELAAVLKAKDEAKKEISLNMTRNWSNTLASIKTQGNQKRMEKMEKIKQDRIETYNKILESRKEEKKKILADVRKIFFEQKDPVLTLNSALLFSQVLDERKKQIEEKKLIQKEKAKSDEVWITKIKKETMEEEREKLEEKLKERQKMKIQRLYLEEQIAERKRKEEEKEAAEMEAAKQDVINMKIEGEKIHNCNMVERDYRKKFTARYIRKTENQLEYERNLALEEIEEDAINNIILEYDRKFKKERREREERIKNEEIEKREKRAEVMAQEMAKAKQKEEENALSAIFEREKKEKQLAEEKEEIRRQGVADLLEGKRKAEERRKQEFYERKEEKKWEMMQQYRRSEINLEWTEEKEKEKIELRAERNRELDLQCKELQERQAAEKREWEEPLEDETKEKEELLQYIDEIMQFTKEQKLPEYPVMQKIMEVKKKNNLFSKKELEEMQKQKEQNVTSENGKRRSRMMVAGCYCLRD